MQGGHLIARSRGLWGADRVEDTYNVVGHARKFGHASGARWSLDWSWSRSRHAAGDAIVLLANISSSLGRCAVIHNVPVLARSQQLSADFQQGYLLLVPAPEILKAKQKD